MTNPINIMQDTKKTVKITLYLGLHVVRVAHISRAKIHDTHSSVCSLTDPGLVKVLESRLHGLALDNGQRLLVGLCHNQVGLSSVW